MTHRNLAIAVIGLTLLSGAAMAQGNGGNGKPRFYVPEQVNTVPNTAVFDSHPSVSGYTSTWSVNPGTFNSQTAEPNFVDHSHGRP
jgi:hypothetical protein